MVTLFRLSTIPLPGASGSGKSTFLNVLCGKAYYGTQSGKVVVTCTEDCTSYTVSSLSEIKNIRGFVP